jgi:hypothetical protein
MGWRSLIVRSQGAINLHNRDRFYYNFGTSIYDMTQADSKSPWASPFTGPNPRGPAEVDTIHPIHIRRNRLETVQKVGAVGVPGEWWGAQNSLFVLDIDDGNARYVIEENLLLATGSNGLKLGHIVDAITVRNNIVVARRGPAVPGGDPDQSPRQDLLAFNIGAMCMENTMNATRNVIVNLDGGRLLASSYGNIGPQALANGQQGAYLGTCGTQLLCMARHLPSCCIALRCFVDKLCSIQVQTGTCTSYPSLLCSTTICTTLQGQTVVWP